MQKSKKDATKTRHGLMKIKAPETKNASSKPEETTSITGQRTEIE